MTAGLEAAAPVHLFSGTIRTYIRNFLKLFLLFFIFIIVLAIPLFIFLPSYVQAVVSNLSDVDALVSYMVVYMLTSLMAPLVKMLAMTFCIGVFTAPFALGLAGKIISDDIAGSHGALKEQMRWTAGNYKKLLSAYAVYYLVFGLFAYLSFALMTGIMASSHIIIERWFTPVMIILPVAFALLLIGLVFVPFGVIDERKSGFRALTHSFRMMYAGGIARNFATLLLGLLIAGAVLFLSQLPYMFGLFGNQGENVLETFISSISVMVNDEIYMIITIAVSALVGVFLYIIAYNTYRKAKHNYAGKHGGIK